jgi:lipopolysaccharide export system protein LptA
MRRFLLACLIGGAVVHSAGAQGAAPTGRCKLNFESDRVTSIQLPSKQYNSFLAGGVVARCPNQKMVLKSDSLEVYGDEGRYFFVGHVDYVEPRLALKSDFLTYFQKEERLLAFLNVDAKLPSGSTLKGNSLEFWRSIPKIRPKQRGVSVGRPTIALVEKDTQGKSQDTVNVTGNTVWLEGDSVVAAQGEVVVVRPQLTATGDSLFLDTGTGLARMMRKPRIVGKKGRPFTLVGETIDLLSRRRKIERVLAKNAAETVSEDLKLNSDTIDLRVTNDLLQRAIVWGKSRAHAASPQQTIVADSIDVLMPAQQLREMHALRNAVAEGVPDTSKFRTTEKDRLTGDTIIAYFDTVPAKDTAAKPRIRMLVAIGHATSLQHLAAQDTACHLPAINYVKGRQIIVHFDSATVRNVEVKDSTAAGVYIEPDANCTAKAPTADAARSGQAPQGSKPPGNAPVPPPTTPTTVPAIPPRRP